MRHWLGWLLAVVLPSSAVAQPGVVEASKARATFVTLGTGGGPVIRLKRSEPANAVVVNGAVYLFDAGDGVQRQMLAADLALPTVRAVFVSHHHIDHNAALGPLLVSRWLFNGYVPLPVIGPPGTVAMVAGIATAFRATELAPIAIGGPPKPALADTIAATDMAKTMDTPTLVYSDENIRVFAITNDHYHFASGSPEAAAARSYSFRIETAGRSFVYTGDTGPSPHLEALAKGADVLISEVIDLAAMSAILERATDIPPGALAPMIAHMAQDHLTPANVGAIAARAGVKQVVLTHLVPGLDSETDMSGYLEGLTATYHGPVAIAHDLDRF
ncbi:MAG: hypothetical protein B7Y45_01200 [Sphingomonas sp. 28-66-16]|nr:MAG: hypothetical protein B7Y45_01200 [Sphingomonas sp. 28-66-16]